MPIAIRTQATDIDGMSVVGFEAEEATHYPLTLIVHVDSRLQLAAGISARSFDEAAVAAIGGRLLRVLGAIGTDASVAIGDVELLDDAERADVLVRWNDTTRALPAGETLVSLFDTAVQAHVGAVATVWDGAELTYDAFASRVNRLARWLISRGAGPNRWSRCRCGGRWIRSSPCTPCSPPAVDTCRWIPITPPSATSTCSKTAMPVMILTGIDNLDLADYSDAPVRDEERVSPLRPDNTAYVIFTSGSTGRPKGVAVAHRSVVNQVRWIADRYGIGPSDVVLYKTPATFDVSVWELYATLHAGARMVIAAPDGHRDPAYLAHHWAQRVTITSFVPSMLAVFLGDLAAPARRCGRCSSPARRWPRTRCGGPGVSPGVGLAEPVRATEFTVHATRTGLAGDAPGYRSARRCGTPARTCSTVGCGPSRRAPGELYLAGAQVARGYGAGRAVGGAVRRQPVRAGERMYRTGDLVVEQCSVAPQAPLVPSAASLLSVSGYLGRNDFQVKFRGLRIELGEIEAVLRRARVGHPAVALVRADVGSRGSVGRLRGARADSDARRRSSCALIAAAELPEYMVPEAIVVLDELPLTRVRQTGPEGVAGARNREDGVPRTALSGRADLAGNVRRGARRGPGRARRFVFRTRWRLDRLDPAGVAGKGWGVVFSPRDVSSSAPSPVSPLRPRARRPARRWCSPSCPAAASVRCRCRPWRA